MANDLAAIKARIASELARSDLTTQIASAITDAITIYQKERFRFSDVDPSSPPGFSTVVDQWIYTSADNANISTLYGIDYVLAQIGSYLQPLEQMPPERIRVYNQLGYMKGQPLWFAYEGNKLLLAPVPSDVYPITLGLFRRIAAPASDGEADNPWMTDGERLIRSRAKYEIALHVTRNPTMQQAMSPYPPPLGQTSGHASYWAWKELKGEANRATSLGRIRAMQF